MDITPVPAFGLTLTANAIRNGQERFDNAAQQVVADTLVEADAAAAVGNLPTDLVGMQVDAIMNNVLYALFRRQSEQQQALMELVKPTVGP